MKSFVEAAGATLPRPDLPASSCESYRQRRHTHGSQLALFAAYRNHGCITDRDGDNTLELEADHRRDAEVENAIRDLKYGVGLNHLPSGRLPANAAWLAIQVMAQSVARRAARISLGDQQATTKTLRRRFFSLAGRLTRKARRLTLHLPQGWPWQNHFKLRTSPIARPAAPLLTAHCPIACRIRTSTASKCLRRQPGLPISPATTTAGRQKSPLAGWYAPRTRPNLSAPDPDSLISAPLIPGPTHKAASLRWIRG